MAVRQGILPHGRALPQGEAAALEARQSQHGDTMSQARQIAASTPRREVAVAPRSAPAGTTRTSLARSAIIVGLAFVLSRILGLVREMVLANQFGTTSTMDAYVSAFRIPDLLFLVVIAGSFGAAFIP